MRRVPKTSPTEQSERPKEAAPKPKPKPPRMTPAEQRRRFIEAAREAGASEDEADFDRTLGAIVKAKTS